jgi:hypothetical protein
MAPTRGLDLAASSTNAFIFGKLANTGRAGRDVLIFVEATAMRMLKMSARA